MKHFTLLNISYMVSSKISFLGKIAQFQQVLFVNREKADDRHVIR